jgi:hypothetical protein
MSDEPRAGSGELPYTASLAEYGQQAEALFRAVSAGDMDAVWRFNTPLDWARYAERGEIARWLEGRGAPSAYAADRPHDEAPR